MLPADNTLLLQRGKFCSMSHCKQGSWLVVGNGGPAPRSVARGRDTEWRVLGRLSPFFVGDHNCFVIL